MVFDVIKTTLYRHKKSTHELEKLWFFRQLYTLLVGLHVYWQILEEIITWIKVITGCYLINAPEYLLLNMWTEIYSVLKKKMPLLAEVKWNGKMIPTKTSWHEKLWDDYIMGKLLSWHHRIQVPKIWYS